MPADIPFTDLAEVNPGRGLKRGERYPFIEMASVLEGGGRPTHHDEREFDGGGSRFAVGDTLFARITPCTENGKIAFVDALPDGSVGFGSTELIVLSARPGKADPRFVYQVAASGRVRRQAIARMLGTSGRQRVPTWFFTEELTVPDFSLAEQRAIAAVLDAIDDTIERTEAVIAATEELRRALLNELLTRGVPGWHSEWRHVPGIGTVPACWNVVRLGDVAEVERGKFAHRPRNEPRFYGGDIPFIQTGDVARANGMITQHSQTLNDLGLSISRLFPAGTIIVTIAANIGQTAIADYPVAFPDSLVGVTPTDINTSFLEYFLRTQKGRLNQFAPESAQKNINLEDLRPLSTPLPSRPEQQAIVAMLDGVGEVIKQTCQEREYLQSLKTSAADALLTGCVRFLVEDRP